MALPSFEVTGNLKEVPGLNISGELYTEPLLSAMLTFRHNLSSDFVVFNGQIYRVDPVYVTVLEDGSISDNENQVLLLANDDGLNVDGLQWQVSIHLPLHEQPAVQWWFDAPGDGDTIDLQTIAHAPRAAANTVVVSGTTMTDIVAQIDTPGSALRGALDGVFGDVVGAEPPIAEGADTDYWRGDKTWQTLSQDVVVSGTTNKVYTATEKTKLSGIATGATANATDAQLRDRATHTGTQTVSTISDFTYAVSAMVAGSANIYRVDDYGADPTGYAVSDAALATARAALGTDPGVLLFGAGTYRLTEPCPTRFYQNQSIRGYGSGATRINYAGTGALFVAYSDEDYPSPDGARFGATYDGMWIDGDGCGDNSCALQLGDMSGSTVDLRIHNFDSTGSAGIIFKNQYTWMERSNIRVHTDNCSSGVIFDASSMMYASYWFNIGANAGQHGVVLKNSAQLHRCNFTLNLACGTGTPNTGIGLWIAAAGAEDGSYITGHIQIIGETDGSSGTGHVGIQYDGSAGRAIDGYGMIELSNPGPVEWEPSTGLESIVFNGPIAAAGLGYMGYLQATRTLGLQTSRPGYMSDTLYLTGANIIWQRYASGEHTLAFDSGVDTIAYGSEPAQAASWDLFFQQPSTGAAATFVWPNTIWWPDTGTAPVMATANNAFDHIRLVTPDFVTFVGQHVGTYSW